MDRIYTACSAKLIIEIWSASHILWLLEEGAQRACLAGISGPPVDDYASAGPCWWGRGVYQCSKNCQSRLPVFVWVHPAVSSDCSTFRTWLLDTFLTEESKHASSSSRHHTDVMWGSGFENRHVQRRGLILKQQLDGNCPIVLGLSSFGLGHKRIRMLTEPDGHLIVWQRKDTLVSSNVKSWLPILSSPCSAVLWRPCVVLHKCILITAVQRWAFVERILQTLY